MRFGVIFDVHGTLINASEAWINAFTYYSDNNYEYCKKWLESKKSRKELAQKLEVLYEDVHTFYRTQLLANEKIVSLFQLFKNHLEVIIVSNAKREDVIADCNAVNIDLSGVKIYSSESGKKPEKEYLAKILKEMNWDYALLVGNDSEEDIIESENIISLMVP